MNPPKSPISFPSTKHHNRSSLPNPTNTHKPLSMFFLKPLLLAGVASAGVMRRATTSANLETIDSDTRALIRSEQSYNGGLFGALAIKSAADKVDQDLEAATKDAQASAPLDEAAAQAAIDYVNNTLEPDVATAIDTLIGKKAQIQRDGVTGTVRDQLTELRADTQTYGGALKGIAPTDKQAGADVALAKVIADFQRGIDAYAS
jgi:hypothetical protein